MSVCMCGFLNAYIFKCVLLNVHESVRVCVSVNVNLCVGCEDLFFSPSQEEPLEALPGA